MKEEIKMQNIKIKVMFLGTETITSKKTGKQFTQIKFLVNDNVYKAFIPLFADESLKQDFNNKLYSLKHGDNVVIEIKHYIDKFSELRCKLVDIEL